VRLGAYAQDDAEASHKPQATSLTEIGVRLATALGEFWMVRGSMIEGHLWLTAMLARVPEPTLLRARALNTLGFITYEGGFGHARELFETSLAISQPLSDRRCIADALYGLGRGGLDTEDRTAPERLLESLALYRELGDKASAIRALNCLGYLVGADADYQRGVKLCEEGLALARELGDMTARAALYHTLGSITRMHGDVAQATELLQMSLDLFYDLGDQAGALFPLLGLADVAQLERDYGRAEALLNDALAQCRKVGSRRHLAWALNNLGDIVLHRGDAATAGRLFADGLALFQKFDRRNGVAQCLLGCAGVAAAQGHAARAARLCGAADALLTAYRTSIAKLPPDDRMHYTLTFTAIHAQLDDTAFAAAWAEGTALTREQAITEALEEIRLDSGDSRETAASSR
jgi:tetratricopeptide (TPR) repeat protein